MPVSPSTVTTLGNDNPTGSTTTMTPNEVLTFISTIFDVVFLSKDAVAILHEYFCCVHIVQCAKALLCCFLLLDDNGAAAILQPFGTLNSADKYNLKCFHQWFQRHNIPDDFDWSTFNDTLYERGPTPSPSITSLPDFPHAPDLPDAVEYLVSDASVTSTSPPANPSHTYFSAIQELAATNRTKFQHQLPYGTDLWPHPDWQVHATTCLLLDTSGFQQATIPTLSSSRWSDVMLWYNQYQQIVFQYSIHVIPYSLFHMDCVTYPCSVPPAHVDAMNHTQLIRFGSTHVFNLQDPLLKLLQEHHLIHHGQETLCA